MSSIFEEIRINPNCMGKDSKRVQMTITYNSTSKAYSLDFLIMGRGCTFIIDFKPRHVWLAKVSRKSNKTEKILAAWAKENSTQLFRQFFYMGGDNMYAVLSYIDKHRPDGVEYPYWATYPKYECRTFNEYEVITDAWEKLGCCYDDSNKIKETYNSLFEKYKSDYKKLTELVMVVNHLCWYRYGLDNNDPVSKVYGDLYYQAKDDFYNVFDGNEEASDYFYNITD